MSKMSLPGLNNFLLSSYKSCHKSSYTKEELTGVFSYSLILVNSKHKYKSTNTQTQSHKHEHRRMEAFLTGTSQDSFVSDAGLWQTNKWQYPDQGDISNSFQAHPKAFSKGFFFHFYSLIDQISPKNIFNNILQYILQFHSTPYREIILNW